MSTLKTNNIQHVDRSDPSIIINTDGSVNIAGTMTYEDVTNVDSVGIITGRELINAQKQVLVGTGVSVKAGGLNVTAGITTVQALQATTGTFSSNASIAGITTISYSGTSQYGLDVYNPTSGSSGARVRAGDNDSQYALLVENGAGTNLFEVLAGGGGARLRSGDLSILDKIAHYGDGNTFIRFPAADTFTVETAGSERIRITSGGDMGLGTNSPASSHDRVLTIAGTNSAELKLTGSNYGVTDTDGGDILFSYGGLYMINNESNGSLHFLTGSGPTERMRITNTGSVGIGTNNPDSKLHVYGATTSYIKIETGDGTTNPIVMHKNPDKIFHTGLRGDASDSYVIRDHSSTANRLVIDTNGKICLGTHNTNFADNDGIVSIVNAASAGTENTLLTLWNPTTAADARASIDFLTNANYGTGRDGGFIRASNDGSSAAAHLIFGKIINETYTKTVKFDTSGDIEIVDGDLVIQTSGHGIDFAAAANSNAGASSSILNDYEEGVYEPTMTGSSGGSHTFVTFTHLAYTKIGNLVHIQGYINTNGGTLTGNLQLSLPFTVSNNSTGHSRYPAIFVSWRAHGWTGNTGVIAFAPQPNTNYGEFISVTPGGSHTWVNNTHVGNNYNIRVGGCYITDA